MTTAGQRQARWDMGPVLQLWNGRSIVELAQRTGIEHRNFVRWLRHGVPDRSADRLGMALGPGPEAIWPEWYNGAGSPKIVDYVASGTVRDAYLRRQRSLASGSAKAPRRSLPRPAPDPLPALVTLPLDRLSARSRGVSDDLVWCFPDWLASAPIPEGLPPRKEDARCMCGAVDGLKRPRIIGRCAEDNCERRPA